MTDTTKKTINRKKFAAAYLEIAKSGVGRLQKNNDQGYFYRGVDDVYNVISPILAAHAIIVSPHFEIIEDGYITTKTGEKRFAKVSVKIDFVDGDADGDEESAVITTAHGIGEARDMGDKCLMKAQTAAVKYALTYKFCLPVIGSDDGDGETPEPVAYNKRMVKDAPAKVAAPVAVKTAQPSTISSTAGVSPPVKSTQKDGNGVYGDKSTPPATPTPAEPQTPLETPKNDFLKPEAVKTPTPPQEDAPTSENKNAFAGLSDEKKARLAKLGIKC